MVNVYVVSFLPVNWKYKVYTALCCTTMMDYIFVPSGVWREERIQFVTVSQRPVLKID